MTEGTAELLSQIALGEDSRLELKELRFSKGKVQSPHRQSMADELAAMANTASGVLVLGVDDKSKEILGIPLAHLDLAERWLADLCTDLIRPQLFCIIQKVMVPAGNGEPKAIIRVDVPRSLFVHQSPGGYFHRVGSSKRPMAPDVLARLFQQRSQTRLIRFDEQAVPGASPDSLDSKLWQKFTTPLSSSHEEQFLTKLGLLTRDQDDRLCPSVTGVLMANSAPQLLIPGAYIQAVHYRGLARDAARQIDAQDIVGPLDQQIRDAVQFVTRNMRVSAIKDVGRVDVPQYSLRAVFEAVVNAVAHRDYSISGSKIRLHMFDDRLELYSPGAIPNTMTIDSLALRQATRNELITSLLARCSAVFSDRLETRRQFLMDRRGEGVPIIFSETEKLAGKPPTYRLIDDSELLLTLPAANPHGV